MRKLTDTVQFVLFSALLAAGLGCAGGGEVNLAPLEFDEGKQVLAAGDRGWNGISRVWYFKPPSVQSKLRVLIVIHGAGRNAEDYLDSWIEIAEEEELFVVAPEFSDERAIRVGGEWEWRFNTGNVVSWFGSPVDPQDWYFESIERLFASIRASDVRVMDEYVLFGHSAGGQFVHRMVLLQPEGHFTLAIAANSGWYTFPDADTDFPYGLAGVRQSAGQLRAAFDRKLVVFLGTADTPDQGGFRSTPEAMLQGSSRVERGERFFQAARHHALTEGLPIAWKLEYAAGVGHDQRAMAGASVRLLQADNLIPSQR